MAMYRYYAQIKLTDEGNYIVTFPDVEGCFTQGSTMQEAVEMAEDALGEMMVEYEDEGNIPAHTAPESFKLVDGMSMVLITTDTDNFKEAV
ncbi:type II toxin-antitoxin system HicB family antitoxin [Lysinibacillus sp. BPa_S21]|uniref:type II toxin-antitoxin system HicB family antitoxin n=1 Tax=Lysinibacillus sp. BPa_S21 TaxID=2932478 RepID=UPI002013158C|nr:type II toxin-antitoxin system HicB family antitoxin [Lysinibacillus sp. BPa_S21]MCL1698320.1 type II toxin-antitoxin system HicB family antitoxin [Lysinibacillus sp. BPa_S21]